MNAVMLAHNPYVIEDNMLYTRYYYTDVYQGVICGMVISYYSFVDSCFAL